MEANKLTNQMPPRCKPLPNLEVPMINAMVACLAGEHRKFNELVMHLAFAATTLVREPGSLAANQRAVEVWDKIRRDLWSHLQIEDELVLSWGGEHQAISAQSLKALAAEHDEIRKLMAALPEWPGVSRETQPSAARGARAETLLAIARILDSHVERYDGEVLPAILRATHSQRDESLELQLVAEASH